MAQSFRDLLVWQEAMDLVVKVYALAREFPRQEQFALTNQLTRAVVFVPANIAEGNGRSSRKDYAHFISIARGSIAEVETLLLISLRLDYITVAPMDTLLEPMNKIGRMLTSLHQKLQV